MTDDEIRAAVLTEIAHAEAKHAPRHVGGDMLDDADRWQVLMCECYEVAAAVAHPAPPPHDLRSELIDIMSVCQQWLRRL